MKKNAPFVFFGTPEFAAIVLQEVTDAGFPPALLVTNPDRPIGRKQVVTPPPAKITAQKYDIPVFQPESSKDIQSELQRKKYDFFVVAAYAKILPQEVLALPRLGVIGVHPSLLPAYRGASPIQSAILAGEKETGVTLYLLDEKVDHGSVLRSAACPIRDDDSYATLSKKLAELGGTLLAETIPLFFRGKLIPKPQDENRATRTKKFATEDGFVEEKDLKEARRGESDAAQAILRKIRALNPEPGVWTVENGKRIKLLEAAVVDGKLLLKKTQIEGRKPRLL